MENNPAESELESFRQRWKEEVSARSKLSDNRHVQASQSSSRGSARPVRKAAPPAASRSHDTAKDDSEYDPNAFHDLEDEEEYLKLGNEEIRHKAEKNKPEPRSALEHYEKAVERETQGNLGDSLNLYRKAFKLDDRVHEKYKNKYFPPSSFTTKPANPNPLNTPVTVPNPAHHSLQGSKSSLSDLIQSFSELSIPPAPPPTSFSAPRACPIASVPHEILLEILLQTALADVASFARLAQVCKRFAYLISTEDSIWKGVSQGPDVGFAAMHYRYACALSAIRKNSNEHAVPDIHDSIPSLTAVTIHDPTPKIYPTYQTQFRTRPRIRFNGCYISIVNYTRAGMASQSQFTWNNPIHIVTYYRYLRFYRDGTVLSLLTTSEPAEVVHHLTKENVHAHRGTGALPSFYVTKDTLIGRWRLSGPASSKIEPSKSTLHIEDQQESSKGPGEYTREPPSLGNDDYEEEEGDLHVETEGVVPKYMWKMQFALASSGRRDGGTRNNKLVWKGFWSYNRLTDDWGAFELKHDRFFYWSRVKSYGTGS